jgi:arylsulfatase
MIIRKAFVALISAPALSAPAFAQQTQQGTPPIGSPAATTTIPGNQTPRFGGLVHTEVLDLNGGIQW